MANSLYILYSLTMRKYLNLRNVLIKGMLIFFFGNSLNLPLAHAQELVLPVSGTALRSGPLGSLPAPGTMIHLSPVSNPPVLKGIKVHPDNPFRFDFILDKGDSQLANEQLKQESNKLIKYFLASLTIPEKDLWVNLSPYEKDRIVPEGFGQTEMGRDLLAQDYILKQITASLIYPEDETGKKFWKRIYEEAVKKFGTTNIPVNTFNKVWILPEKAVVYENAQAGTAYVVESKLKVMLEQDYLALKENAMGGQVKKAARWDTLVSPAVNALGSQIVREIVIPELTREVNQGKNFEHLRQVYNSLILATWYKKKITNSIFALVYRDKNKVNGINIQDPQEKQRIYEQYLQAFKKGVYNYIKEEIDPMTKEPIPRKYFSGGAKFNNVPLAYAARYQVPQRIDNAMAITSRISQVGRNMDSAMPAKEIKQIRPVADAILQPFLEANDYEGALQLIRNGDLRKRLESKKVSGLAVHTVISELTNDLREKFLRQIKQEVESGKFAHPYNEGLGHDVIIQLRKLREIARKGDFLGLSPQHISIIGHYVQLRERNINVTLNRLLERYPLRDNDNILNRERRDTQNLIRMDAIINHEIRPLLHGVVDIHYKDKIVADGEEADFLSLIDSEEEVAEYARKPEAETVQDLVNFIIFDTGADQQKVEEHIRDLIGVNTKIEDFYTKIRETMSSAQRIVKLEKHQQLIISGHYAVYYLNRLETSRINNLTRADAVGLNRYLTQFVRKFSSDDPRGSLREIAQDVYHLDATSIKLRLILRKYDKEVLIVAALLPSEVKRGESGSSGLSSEIQGLADEYSAKNKKIFESLEMRNVRPLMVSTDAAMFGDFLKKRREQRQWQVAMQKGQDALKNVLARHKDFYSKDKNGDFVVPDKFVLSPDPFDRQSPERQTIGVEFEKDGVPLFHVTIQFDQEGLTQFAIRRERIPALKEEYKIDNVAITKLLLAGANEFFRKFHEQRSKDQGKDFQSIQNIGVFRTLHVRLEGSDSVEFFKRIFNPDGHEVTKVTLETAYISPGPRVRPGDGYTAIVAKLDQDYWKSLYNEIGIKDFAMPVEIQTSLGRNISPGGIDLTANKTPLEIQNAGNSGVQIKVSPAILQQLQNASGFTPVIINIQPMTDLRLFLGLSEKRPKFS